MLTARLQSTNLSTDCSTSGTLGVTALYLSRYVFFWYPWHFAADFLMKDLVCGLDGVMFNDLMENIEWFFNLHDKNKDGYLTKDEVLTLSESFLVCLSSAFINSPNLFLVHFPL